MDEKKTKISKEEEVKKAVATLTDVTISMSSTELTQTAGGEIRPKIKVYDVDPQKAYDKAVKLMDDANKKYKVKE